MSGIKLTKSQQDCVDVHGNILVSAAAGSGKTAVLTERVIKLITGKSPVDADSLIVVTYTVAAADEMRQRISMRLSDMLENDPQNENLQRQQLLLSKAKISTIHSLCSTLLHDNFQALSLSREFRLADEGELDLLKSETVDEILNEEYEKEQPAFLELCDFFASKNDRKLTGIILSIYNFIRSFPFPKDFLKKTLESYKNAHSISDNIWYSLVKEHVKSSIDSAILEIDRGISEMSVDPLVSECYIESFRADKALLSAVLMAVELGEWDNAVNMAQNPHKLALKAVRKYEDKQFLESIKKRRDNAYAILGKLSQRYLACTEQEFLEDIEVLTFILTELFAVIEKLCDRMEQKKMEAAMLDFDDLEHYAVKLLVQKGDNGYEKTEIAKAISEDITEIMVDECQDINEKQNLIFKMLSKNEANLFMVGDVKQSIYRFRKAVPALFIEKYKRFPEYNRGGGNTTEKSIVLERNFRSRREICEYTNFVFSQVMNEEIAEIDYDKRESLVAGAEYPQNDTSIELHLIDYQKGTEDEADKATTEAMHIARTIKSMVQSGYMVTDRDILRPCEYRDFAVLLRSKKTKAPIIASALKKANIPCFSDSTEGYFSEYEITVILNLLRVIDNPLLDVSLLSVLMSSMFGFTADEVAKIRITDRQNPFFLALKKYAEQSKRCQDFVALLESLRVKARIVNVDMLLQEIYDITDFISLSYAAGNGEQKDANLRLLLTYAQKYEKMGSGGLSGFLRYIDRIIENKKDFVCANISPADANTVKIMSIHSSKGLEFPVCIVADCGKNFNRTDLNEQYQMNNMLGVGMKINDTATMRCYSNLPFEAIRLKTEKETLAEEMRILYVAITRAKEKLIMTMAIPSAEEKLKSIAMSLNSERKLSAFSLYSAKGTYDWLLMTALRHPDTYKLRQEIGINDITELETDFSFKLQLITPEIQQQEELCEEEIKKAEPSNELVERLNTEFNFKYPYELLTRLPVKLTATKLAKQSEQVMLSKTPAFMQKLGMSPAMRGTALHSFMQYADYAMAESDLEGEIARLRDGRFITETQAEVLNLNKITAFLHSDLYQRMKISPYVRREYKFLSFLKASEVDEAAAMEFPDEQVLLQGIADCVFQEGDGLILVDYKTDYIDDDEIFKQKYYNQLRIYKRALEETFGKEVKQALIYSLHMEKEIAVEIK